MSNYTITYKVTQDLDNFEFWSGARDRMNDATNEQREQVFERIAEEFEYNEDITETDINDLVWFECDDIFFPDDEDEDEDEGEEEE